MKKKLIKNIQNKGISGLPISEINEIKQTIRDNDNKYLWLDRSNQHILKAPFIGRRDINYLGIFNDCIRCYKGGSGELASEVFITPTQISFKLFDETLYNEEDPENKARIEREIFIYNRHGAIELWSSGEILVRDPNNFTSKKYVDIVVGDNVFAINEKINTANAEIGTIKTDLGDLGNQVVDNHNEIAATKTSIDNLNTKTDNTNTMLNNVINGLRDLRPFNYLGAYQQGTTYKRNDLVSLNNTLYLSNEDNNNTTPPGDKWVVLQEQVQIDLSNYYNKPEIDSKENALNERISSVDTKVTNLSNIAIKNNLNNQTIPNLTFTSSEAITFKGNGAKYLSIKNNSNQRIGYIGQPSSTSNDLEYYAELNDLKLSTKANKSINVSTGDFKVIDNEGRIWARHLKMGYGSTQAWITPEDSANKTLFFSKANHGKFDLNMSGTSRILNLPNPTENAEAATKLYVDTIKNKIKEIAASSTDFNDFKAKIGAW